MLTRRGVSDLEEFDTNAVQAKFGFLPPLLPDFKGLRGDSSDNIPGVPGIGDKTAMSLIGRFGALENVYEHLDEVTPPRIKGLLETHRDIAFQSRELARIITDLPVELDFEACRYGQMDEAARETALSTVRLFEFKSMIPRYMSTHASDVVTGQTTQDESPALPTATSETRRAASAEEVESWLQADAEQSVAMLLNPGGIALARGNDAIFYAGAATDLKSWLQDDSRGKIVHDAKTLKLSFHKLGIDLRGVNADSLLMGYLLDPTRQNHPLAQLSEKYLSRKLPVVTAPVVEKPAKKSKKAATSLFDEETETADAPDSPAPDAVENSSGVANDAQTPVPDMSTHAAAQDTLSQAQSELSEAQQVLCVAASALFSLEPALRAALRTIGEETIFDELEMPLVDVLVTMEECGMLLDVAQLRVLDEKLIADAARQQAEVWASAGEQFNIGSTKQLQVVLFEKLKLAKGRATKTGYSTDVHTLEKLAEEHDIVRQILDYRSTTKLKSTYVDALLNGMDKVTHRIHTNLNQTGTVSGRLSSSEPNLQNVPIRTEQGRLIRKAFIAPPGHVVLAADYSQIELRILAHITNDEPLVEAFRAGEDVHIRTAADLFDVPIDQVDSEMRRKAKMTNYAIAYGVSGFGLAKQLGSGSAGEAAEFIKRYFEALPGVKNYIDDTLRQARSDGYVQTLMGRRRPLPEITSPRAPERTGAERTAINHPIQGTSADVMKLAMLAVADELKTRKLRSRMTMQVHDELVFEVPDDEAETMCELVGRLMREVPTSKLKLSVPLEVEVETGPNWNDTASFARDEAVDVVETS
jgi:DNA polymerase-1